MKTLVTGGSGAIGHYVANELLDRGHEVTIFDIREPNIENVEFIHGDITERDSVNQIPPDVDYIVHMAALLAADCAQNPLRAEQVNVFGTVLLFERATEIDARIVTTSSIAVVGPIVGKYAHPRYEPIGEDAPREPTNTYGATKLACEHYAEAYRRSRQSDIAAVRFPTTYGPGKTAQHGGPGGVLSQFIEDASKGKTIRLPGAGQGNDFIYFKEIANAIAELGETESLTYGTYHIGSGRPSSFRDFGDALREVCPDATIQIDEEFTLADVASPNLNCVMDISRIKSDTRFEPEFDPENAIRDFVNEIS